MAAYEPLLASTYRIPALITLYCFPPGYWFYHRYISPHKHCNHFKEHSAYYPKKLSLSTPAQDVTTHAPEPRRHAPKSSPIPSQGHVPHAQSFPTRSPLRTTDRGVQTEPDSPTLSSISAQVLTHPTNDTPSTPPAPTPINQPKPTIATSLVNYKSILKSPRCPSKQVTFTSPDHDGAIKHVQITKVSPVSPDNKDYNLNITTPVPQRPLRRSVSYRTDFQLLKSRAVTKPPDPDNYSSLSSEESDDSDMGSVCMTPQEKRQFFKDIDLFLYNN